MSLKEMCKSLRLAYVAEIYESIPTESPEKFLTELFSMEMRLREEAKAQRLIKKAKFIMSCIYCLKRTVLRRQNRISLGADALML